MQNKFVRIFALLTLLLVIAGVAWYVGSLSKSPSPQPEPPNGEALEISLLISAPDNVELPAPENDFVLQAIQNKFNIALKIEYIATSQDYNSRLADLLNNNNPPDMWLELSQDGGSKSALNETIADMTPYVSPATMPNYFKFWVTEQVLKDYQLHNRFYRAPLPYGKNSYRSYYIRADWLEQLHMDIPSSYEEYLEVLRAFTNKDPDRDGLANTYGFTTSGNSATLSTEWPEFIKNGLLYPAYTFNDKLIDFGTDPRIEFVIDDISRVIKEGLVDPDWFLNQNNEHIDKAIQGYAGVVLGETVDFAYDSDPRSLQAQSRKINPQANWLPFNPFGNEPVRAGIDPGYPFVFSKMIADHEPAKIRKVVELLDWLAGPEGYLLTHYGVEGRHYTRSGNTITLITPAGAEDQIDMDFLDIWSFFTPEAPSVLGFHVINPALTERDKGIKEYLASLPLKDKLGTTLTPPQEIDVDAFRSKQHELHIKMLFSDRSGRNWPSYREMLMTQYHGAEIFQNYEKKIKLSRKSSSQ